MSERSYDSQPYVCGPCRKIKTNWYLPCPHAPTLGLPEAVAGNASAPVGEPSATVVSANESAVIPLDKLSEEWDRLDRYYSRLADVAAGAGYDKGSFIGKSIGFSVCAAQLRAALPASSGMGSGQPPGVGEPRNEHELLVGGIVRAALELAILRGDLRMDSGSAFEEMSESEREDVITDTWNAMNGEGTCDDEPIKELTAIYAALAREVGEGLREALEQLFYEAFIEDRDADVNTDRLTLGERCEKYAAKVAALAAPAPKPAPRCRANRG